MEAKVTVLTPNARRQIVKVSPNKTLLEILEEVCQKHEIDIEQFCLKHHNKEVTLSQQFRFSGLPNNCLLEMVETDKKRVTTADVDICVQFENGDRKQGKFKPVNNLWDVINNLGEKSVIENIESPVVVYMRQEVIGKGNLMLTTLKSLGILEGRALLRLVDKKPEDLKKQANVYVPAKEVIKVEETEKPAVSKNKVPGVGGFAITKDLVNALKKPAAVDEMEVEKEDANIPKDEPVEPEKPKYDWGTAPGHSMQLSQVSMETEDNANQEEIIVPEYNIIGERNALIYSLNAIDRESEDLPDSFYDLTVNDLKLVLRDLKKIANGDENAPLLTSKLRELEENSVMLKKMAQYRNCILRIQFPDRHVLQGMFKPVDKISDVLEFVKGFLNDGSSEFYLFSIPPKTKLNSEKTLLEMDFVPNALVHFSFVDESLNDGEIIKAEFLKDLTSAEGALYAAAKLRQTKGTTMADSSNITNNNNDNSKNLKSMGAIPKRPLSDKKT